MEVTLQFERFIDLCADRRRVTVRELLVHARCLGLPGFQRGAVWDGSQADDLLDSLHRNFFVGTLLLWVPPTPDLPPGTAPLIGRTEPRALRALLLDGQQRVRALYRAFVPRVDEKGTADPLEITCVRLSSEGQPAFWHGRRREGDKSGGAFPLALFAGMVDGLEQSAAYYPYAFRSGPGGAGERPPERRSLAGGDSAWGAVPEALLDIVRRLLDASVAVEVVRFEEAKAIFNYRRLNAGGSGLSNDELDFAAIVEKCPEGPSVWLQRSLDAWREEEEDQRQGGEPESAGDDDPDEEDELLELRDSLLERGQERQFGLRLLVRAVGIACDLAAGETGQETGRRLDSERLGQPARASALLEHAGASVLAMASILNGYDCRDEEDAGLWCDDRCRIPRNGAGFGAALALLIRYPELRSVENRQIMRAILLGFFLDKGPADAFRTVARSLSAEEAVIQLLGSLRRGLGAGKLAMRVEEQRTSFGPLVDVLYWLLRRGRVVEERRLPARDVPFPTASGAYVGVGGRLRLKCRATRQHIVPWSKVTPRPARTAEHWVNSIGNLTWISGEANGLDGWGARPMAFGEAGPEHFAEHFDPLLAVLVEAGTVPSEGPSPARALVEARAEAIGEALQAWWDEAAGAASEHVLRATAAPPFPKPRTLRDVLFQWWQDEQLVDLAELVIFRIGWAKATSNSAPWGPGEKHRKNYLARVRTRRTWTGALPELVDESGQFRIELRWPGEDAAAPTRWLVFDRDSVTLPERPDGTPARRLVTCEQRDCDDLIKELRGMIETWPELRQVR